MSNGLVWIVTGITLMGTTLNALGRKESFYIWIITNLFWVIHNLLIREIPQAIIYIINFITCIIGIYCWSDQDDK